MRIFRTCKKTVVDHFSQEVRHLPGDSVVFEFTGNEWTELEQEELEWLCSNLSAAEFDENSSYFRLYFVFSSRNQHWRMFQDIVTTRIDLTILQALISMIRRKPFELKGRPAFDFISFLFIDVSQALQRGNKWQLQSEKDFRVIGNPHKWSVRVIVPSHLKGLLIGPGGKTINTVERYTDFAKNRISLKDE